MYARKLNHDSALVSVFVLRSIFTSKYYCVACLSQTSFQQLNVVSFWKSTRMALWVTFKASM